jgi:hypothetical protein
MVIVGEVVVWVAPPMIETCAVMVTGVCTRLLPSKITAHFKNCPARTFLGNVAIGVVRVITQSSFALQQRISSFKEFVI